MQSMFNFHASHGLPLCLSGISQSHPLPLSTQMADHDRRRQAMKKLRQRSELGVEDYQVMIQHAAAIQLAIFETELVENQGVMAKAA